MSMSISIHPGLETNYSSTQPQMVPAFACGTSIAANSRPFRWPLSPAPSCPPWLKLLTFSAT